MHKSTNKHSRKTMLSLTAAALLAASLPSAGIAAEAPTTGTPQAQATDTSQTPAAGTPQTPTTDTTQTPAAGTTQTPAKDTTQTPATGAPQTPAAGTTQTPPVSGTPTTKPTESAATPAATAKDPFYDIVRDPNRDAIMTLYNEGIVKPAKDRKFRPKAEIGRSDFTVILGRAMNAKGSVFDVYFKDPIPDWAIRYVGGLSALGIYDGYLDGDTFGPTQPVTRAEAAAMVARAAHLESQPLPMDLGGATNVPIWALDDVGAAYAAGLITVTDTGTLNPNKKVTRSEMAAMIAPLVKSKAFMQPVKIEDDITLP
ncbi:hypothetical protein CDO73_09900 [Saccharibacillus sp. O23]|uniref:S-layer homology domain-containing protein n=1 Tax=Saccharibacillus sp. O23 TaxID=2009338 RepID=UPI000B4E7DB1|nr:S-layer homology domain-containing protein [Saccharibacillus sp. O23]OWR30890.1 hypothetical protein CDO73_09900 [Saccharibacillus sp. O23]